MRDALLAYLEHAEMRKASAPDRFTAEEAERLRQARAALRPSGRCYEMEISLKKGEGSVGLCDQIQTGLVVEHAMLRPGTYRVTIERLALAKGEKP